MKKLLCVLLVAVATSATLLGVERAVVTGGKAVGLVGENGSKVEVGDGFVTLADHKALYYAAGIPEGPDVEVRVKMAIDGLAKSAAILKLGDQFYGFEGADGKVFTGGGVLAKARCSRAAAFWRRRNCAASRRRFRTGASSSWS